MAAEREAELDGVLDRVKKLHGHLGQVDALLTVGGTKPGSMTLAEALLSGLGQAVDELDEAHAHLGKLPREGIWESVDVVRRDIGARRDTLKGLREAVVPLTSQRVADARYVLGLVKAATSLWWFTLKGVLGAPGAQEPSREKPAGRKSGRGGKTRPHIKLTPASYNTRCGKPTERVEAVVQEDRKRYTREDYCPKCVGQLHKDEREAAAFDEASPAPAEGHAAAPLAHPLSDEDFTRQVLEVALSLVGTEAAFGPDKVFIHRVFAAGAARFGGDLGTFKGRLLELNRKRLLSLARADLVSVMNPEDVAASTLEEHGSRYNFLVIPERPAHEVPSLRDFARQVLEAARALEPNSRAVFGDDKAFVSHVYRAMAAETRGTLEEFKARLMEANRAHLLNLSRADMVELMDRTDVQESEIRYLGATFHFIGLRGRP